MQYLAPLATDQQDITLFYNKTPKDLNIHAHVPVTNCI